MAPTRSLVIKITGETIQLHGALDGLEKKFGSFEHQATRSTSSVGMGLKSIGTIGLAIGAMSFFGKAIEEAGAAMKVMKQTNTVLQSTHEVAKVSAAQVKGLADSLSLKVGVDHKVIQSGENVLLTFTKVRNEAGAGNDVFNQATVAALNVSAALGTDLQGSIMLVGKALNDPVKGMTAMTRAGIQFTAQQKADIKVLVAKGDTLGAQKIILKELQSQFGGMAEASAGSGAKMKVAMTDLAEHIGTFLMPAIIALRNFVIQTVIPALEALAQKFGPFLKQAVDMGIASFRAVAKFLGEHPPLMWAVIGALIALKLAITGVNIVLMITSQTPVVRIITLIIAVVGALVGAFTYLWTHNAAFRVFFITAWETIKAVVENTVGAISGAITFAWGSIIKPTLDALVAAWHAVATAVTWFWNVILSPILTVIGAALGILAVVVAVVLVAPFVIAFRVMAAIITWWWETVVSPIFNFVAAIFTWIWNVIIRPIIDLIIAYIKLWASVVVWLYQNVILPIIQMIGAIIRWLWDNVIRPIFDLIVANLGTLGNAFSWVWNNVIRPAWDALGNGISWVWNNVIRPVFDYMKIGIDGVGRAFQSTIDWIHGVWDGLVNIVRAPVGLVIDFINKFVIGSINGITGIFGVPPIPNIPHFADGGQLRGPGGPRSDKMLIAASPGEYMVNAAGVGRGNNFAVIDAINSGVLTFAGGGPIVPPTGGPEANRGKPGSSNLLTSIGDLFNLGKGILADGASALLKPLIGNLSHIVGGNKFGDIMVGALNYIVDKAVGWVRGKQGALMAVGGGGGSGGAGVQQWAGLVLQVLAMLGQPASLLPNVLRRMTQESGGNPNIVNNWDSNALAGTPSMGLMQTIMPTFLAYAGPFAGLGILNPLANIYAGLNYAMHRYPSLQYAMDKPGGYWSGGMVPGPTGQSRLAIVHGGEYVATASQVQAARSSQGNGGDNIVNNYSLTVYANEFSADDLTRAFNDMSHMGAP